MSSPSSQSSRKITLKPHLAIIGGGIFGATCALVLGRHYVVTLFERHDDILSEASYANQYRHHMGYHYPRSQETINEIKTATADFERFYDPAIIRRYPSYYAIAREGSQVSSEEFLNVCDRAGLPYEHEYPSSDFLNPQAVSLCLKTPEAVYDYEVLKRFIRKTLNDAPAIELCLKQTVVGAHLNDQGQKVLTIAQGKQKSMRSFDGVINATYANYNTLCGWLGFPQRELELRLKELPVIQLKTETTCGITIMDGPFATLIPTGQPGIFTFGDVPLSIHETHVTNQSSKELQQHLCQLRSRWPEMQQRCAEWMPVLKTARYLTSMFVILPVELAARATDARPTTITYHGSGCWSVFSGKIITSVSAAHAVLAAVQKEITV